jgi:hypothetical protein
MIFVEFSQENFFLIAVKKWVVFNVNRVLITWTLSQLFRLRILKMPGHITTVGV